MNSDEDPSFPFICEGPSGVLAIFGESSGVLPVMSTSAEVADLEDVFAKASMPIQTTQSDSQENTVNAKSSANVLSEFPDTVLAPPEESKKADEINVPVLSNSIGLSEEIQEVLIESDIVAENAGLVPVVETTKTITETTSTAVTGSVELAEEIMEAFANSKSVLDTENPVSNDPCTLQEELDRLEQLAVERVREIEGDLVNSTKQITECNMSLNVPKESESTDETGNKQKEFATETVVPDASDTSAKDVGESLCEDVPSVDLTSPSELVSVVPEISSSVVDVEKKQIKPSNIDLSESIVNSSITQEKEPENSELIDIIALEEEKRVIIEDKNDDPTPEPKDKIENPVVEIQEKSNDAVSKLKGKTSLSVSEVEVEVTVKDSELVRETVAMLCDIEGKSEKKNTKDCEKGSKLEESEIARCDGGKKELFDDKVECSVTADIQITQEIIVEKHCLSDKSGANKDNPVKMANANKNISETAEVTAAKVVEEDKQIKDMQNYETEDDDLEVLEAFIVKTATNPELAVCAVQPSKDGNVSKYSLESSLLDDLTKVDNGSSTNEVENRSGKANEDSSLVQSDRADSSALEKPSQKIASTVNGADTNSKACGNAVGHHLGLQASSVSSEKKVSQKECASETSGDEIVSSDNATKSSNKKTEKKVVFVEVKRRTGRPLISGKKASIGELLRKESTEPTASEKLHSQKDFDVKPAKQDQSSNKRSMRNSKKVKVDEENVPSTSGTVSAPKVAEQSGVSKIQKQSVEQNSNSSASTSKTTLKINENKGEVRPTTVVNIVETSSKEKKKPKDMESNNDEKSTTHANLESLREKRNAENDSAFKPSKKDERRLKENVESPPNRSIKRQSNNSDVTNSRSTRSAKKMVTVKSTQPTNLSEHTKEKNKENVEKSTNVPVGDGDLKRKAGRSSPKDTPSKNEVGQPQKRSRTLTEDGWDAKKKNDGNLQVSAAIKQNRCERVEGLPNSQASTSTPKKVDENSDRGSASPKASSVSVTQKVAEEKNVHDSGTPVKRKKAEKEVEDSLTDVSPTSVKRKRGESREKEISAATQIPSDALKRKKAETDIALSTQSFQASPTILKHKRVGREFEQNMPNDEIELTHVTHCDSNRTGETLPRIPNVYSDNLFVEFEEITFDMLQSKAKQLVLPTPLWGAQVSSGKDLVAFSRLRADLSDDKPMIDKALVFQGSLKPIALINNEPVDLPIPCVRTFEDVVMLIRNFHSVSFCEGTGVKQRPQSKSCFRYLDVANPGGRCSQCLEERRRVLFGCARKLRERINVMKAAKSRQ